MRDFVKQQQDATEHDTRFRREVQIGLDAANAGDVASAEVVEAEAVAWRAETRRKMTEANSSNWFGRLRREKTEKRFASTSPPISQTPRSISMSSFPRRPPAWWIPRALADLTNCKVRANL